MLDHNGGYVVSAFLITVGVIGAYALYLRSRLAGLRQRLARGNSSDGDEEQQPERAGVAAGGVERSSPTQP